MATQQNNNRKNEQGNVLVLIFIAIALVAALTLVVERQTATQSDIITRQTADDEINRLLTQVSTIGSAVHQQLINGETAETLYTTISTLRPGDAGFETAPHNRKIYHPLGGGITYMASSIPAASAVATNFSINPGAIITGVGATDVTIGDIVFTAQIADATTCGRINQIRRGSSTIPVMQTAAFTTLFTTTTAVTITAVNCASCVNIPDICVSNTGGTAWGYYSVLLPG